MGNVPMEAERIPREILGDTYLASSRDSSGSEQMKNTDENLLSGNVGIGIPMYGKHGKCVLAVKCRGVSNEVGWDAVTWAIGWLSCIASCFLLT